MNPRKITIVFKICWLLVAKLLATTKGKSQANTYLVWTLLFSFLPTWVMAEPIVPARDGTNTEVRSRGDRFDITGGQTSRDGANLFHSFTQFGLDRNQTANFISNPAIRNILSRINGGDPSIINGLIQVTGGNSNLFLMNPAGIVFGANARLDVPGSFTATTATGIGIGDEWFKAIGTNNYASLVGTPSWFDFATSQTPGAIVNTGSLRVAEGENLTLLGGTVVSTGSLQAPEGTITIATVPGESTLRITQPGHILSLEVSPSPSVPLTPLSLPQLLTGSGQMTGFEVNRAGQIEVSGSGIPVQNGDIVAKNVTSQTATLSAQNNLTLVESQLQTTGNLNLLAHNTVIARDSVANPFSAKAGGNLYIQGDESIDILALNHPETPFQSGRNLSLVSNGNISGDAHFFSGGSFSILNLSSEPGTFISLYDPIIRADGDVQFGDYTGVALMVEATGSIEGGNIKITGPESVFNLENLLIAPDDFLTLTTSRALILRAGLSSVTPVNFPSSQFQTPASPLASGSIKVGSIDTSADRGNQSGGPVILSAPGNITVTGTITTSGRGNGAGGDVNITSTNGNIQTNAITARARGNNNDGGDVTLIAIDPTDTIEYGDIDATASGGGGSNQGQDGKITIRVGSEIIMEMGELPAGRLPQSIPGDTTGSQTDTTGTDTTGTDTGTSGTGTVGTDTTGTSTGTVGTDSTGTGTSGTGTVGTDSTGTGTSGTGTGTVGTGTGTVGTDSTGTGTSGTGTSTVGTGTGTVGTDSTGTGTSGTGTSGNTSSDNNSGTGTSGNTSSDNNSGNQSTSEPNQSTTDSSSVAADPESKAVAEVENRFTQQFEDYLDLPGDASRRTLAETREILSNTEKATGVKPALLYVGFVPPTVLDSEGTPAPARRQEEQDLLEVLVVTSDGSVVRKPIEGATRTKVLKVADEFRSQVTNVRSRDGYLTSGKQLYDWLIAPLEATLKERGIQNIAFAMDSRLRSLPLGALYDGQQFLIEKYSVGLMPSLSLTDTRYQDIKELEVLAMGAAKFSDQRPLPAVPTELSTITSLWQGESFLNNAFTLGNLKTQRQERPFGIIHLATHANFVPGQLSNSYIQLWDTKLRLDQLSELGWNNPPVDLLVLSACRTALGNEEAELGFAGLAVQAGVKSAVGSLWYVSDEGTLGLMTQLYEQLKQAPIKAEALRLAQLAMLKGKVSVAGGQLVTESKSVPLPPELAQLTDRNFQHPYYWSAFTLIGSPW